MQEVNISELKARLSHYLQLVRDGNEVIVKDRDRRVARIVPEETPARKLPVIPARLTRKQAEKLLAKLPKPNLSKITPEVVDETLRWMK
jgi:prevent-host-death family protein